MRDPAKKVSVLEFEKLAGRDAMRFFVDTIRDGLGMNCDSRWEPEPEFEKVYFIGNISEGRVKIGVSKDPTFRLRGLQTGCPFRLSVLAIINGAGVKVEHELHRQFSNYRLHGEWFTLAPEINTYMEPYTTNVRHSEND